MITIDSREKKRAELATHLANLGETEFEISDTERVRGENGEWKWPSDLSIAQPGRTIGVQRKTISDFVSSIDSLKETMRLGREGDTWQVFALLLEGEYERQGGRLAYRRGQYFSDGVTLASLHNFQWSQQLRGSPVLRTHSLEETARLLHHLHHYQGPTIATEHGSPSAVLQSLPGIGSGKAEQLLETFGSPLSAMDAIDEWDTVDGIGAGTQEKCEDVLL